MREIKWRKIIRQLTFHHVTRKKGILGYTDAAQLQRWTSDAVMITADVLTSHFGIHRILHSYSVAALTVKELVLCFCIYRPNRLGWRQKVLKPLKKFMLLSWWCPLGQDKGNLLAREYIIMNRLIPILTHLSSHWKVPLILDIEQYYS